MAGSSDLNRVIEIAPAAVSADAPKETFSVSAHERHRRLGSGQWLHPTRSNNSSGFRGRQSIDESSGSGGLLRACVNGRGPDCEPLNFDRQRAEILEPFRMHELGHLLKAEFYIATGNKIANLGT